MAATKLKSFAAFPAPCSSVFVRVHLWFHSDSCLRLALSVFSLLGLYVSLNATTEVRISENYESRQQARLAARAGLNHARELIRGLELNDLLRGPDGLKPDPSTYPSTLSGQYAFRNWV